MSTQDQQRWFAYYRESAKAETPSYSQSLSAIKPARVHQVVALAMSLSERTIESLNRRGVNVETVPTMTSAIQRAESCEIEMVISDLHGTDYYGADLCRRLQQCSPPVLSVILTERANIKDFELCLYSGASMVVGKPCGQDFLILRVLDFLQRDKNQDLDLPNGNESHQTPQSSATSGRPILDQLSQWATTWMQGAQRFLRSGSAGGEHKRDRSAA
jgi:DNA-binding response OmpR family regulator